MSESTAEEVTAKASPADVEGEHAEHPAEPAAAAVAAEQAEEEEEEEGEEDWKVQAEEFKTSGNDAFKEGQWAQAVEWYSKAIEMDPENRVYFSNRSAAYLKMGGAKSKALKDAEACMALAPTWPKSHSRLGAAQHALGRFDAAVQTCKDGLKLDPDNTGLQQALEAAKEGQEGERRARWAKAARDREEEEREKERRAKAAADAKVEAERVAKEEALKVDPLSSFFTDISGDVQKATEQVLTEQKAATEKYASQSLGTSSAQMDRLLSANYKWKNLNPFLVLQLDTDASTEDIKQRYRKLSALVHPDKQLDEPRARDAFEEVKKAYQALMDENRRKTLAAIIAAVRARVKKERRVLLEKGMQAQALLERSGSEEAHTNKALMKEFADQELRRREIEKHRQAQKKRERDQEEEEKTKLKKSFEHEKAWREENRREDRVGNWRDFNTKGKKKAKTGATSTKMWKEEQRSEEEKSKTQGGANNLDTAYRKNWK